MNASLLLRRQARGAALRTVQRRFASSGPRSGHGSAEYGGFEPPHVADWHKYLGEGSMVVMFLWIFWRVKQDGGHFFVRYTLAAARRPRGPALASHDAHTLPPLCQGLHYPWEAHGDPYTEDFKAFRTRASSARLELDDAEGEE